MNRFFLSHNQIHGKKVEFPPDISHQILNVLRLAEGDQVGVLDNRGSLHRVVLLPKSEGGHLQGEILDSTDETSEPEIKITLCFGMTAREKVEWILQKGTEVGVSTFVPFISSRTLVQSTSVSQQKQVRWQRIIREAAEQSHRGFLPELKAPMTLDECIQSVVEGHDLSLVAWEQAAPIQNALHQVLLSDKSKHKSIALFIGPEGGFSKAEIELATGYGCQVVSLGSRILRMETACVVFPALVLYELQKSNR